MYWNPDSDGAVHTVISLLCVEKFIALDVPWLGWRPWSFLMLDGQPVSAKEAAKVKIVPVHDKAGRKPTEERKTLWKATQHDFYWLKVVMDKPLDISWVQYFPNVFFFFALSICILQHVINNAQISPDSCSQSPIWRLPWDRWVCVWWYILFLCLLSMSTLI